MSFISWFSFLDFGFGHSLRNIVAKLRSSDSKEELKEFVSSAYIGQVIICAFTILLVVSAGLFMDWGAIFNSEKASVQLNVLMPIMLISFICQIPLRLIVFIYIGDQKHSFQELVALIQALINLIVLLLCKLFINNSLLYIGLGFSLLPLLFLFVMNIKAFGHTYSALRPALNSFRFIRLKESMTLGLKFFLIQISALVVFSSDNFLIIHFFGPEEVVPYNLIYKYFSIANMALLIVVNPFWSAITDAYSQAELSWVMRSIKRLLMISSGSIIVILVMYLFLDGAFNLWIPEKIDLSTRLKISIGMYFIVANLHLPFTYFLNGIGKIKIQMIVMLIGAIANIPLSYVYGVLFGLGASGVILATLTCLIPYLIIVWRQYVRIVQGRAQGLWDA